MDIADARPTSDSSTKHDVIEVRLRELRQLFDAMDPSPFREKDLDPKAEEYIVESFGELAPRRPRELVIHIDQPPVLADEDPMVVDAVRVHFARRASLLRRDLHRLLRRGFVSLGIGVAFLGVVFALSQLVAHLEGESAVAKLFREGLLIVGWVAMWRPLEIFLYDWWPILGDLKINERLSRISLRIVHGGGSQPDRLTDRLAEENAKARATPA